MADPTPTGDIARDPAPEGAESHHRARRIRMLLWGLVSLGFLALVFFGSVEARIWRFNRLYFEERKIYEVWSFEGRNLPDLSSQWLISVLFNASVIALIAGTVLGLWYLLDEAGVARKQSTSPAHDTADHA